MKKFLFVKNVIQLDFIENNLMVFNNSLKDEKINFYFDKNASYFLLKKQLKRIYLGNARGFICILELIGLGFSVTVKGNVLRFNVGFNHSIYYKIPSNVIIKSKRKTLLVFSNCFFSLRKVIIDLKNFKKLSVYKLKGIKEKNELYKKKN